MQIMGSAHNCEAPRLIVGSGACRHTGQYEPCFRSGVDATAKIYSKLHCSFCRSNTSIVPLLKLNILLYFTV